MSNNKLKLYLGKFVILLLKFPLCILPTRCNIDNLYIGPNWKHQVLNRKRIIGTGSPIGNSEVTGVEKITNLEPSSIFEVGEKVCMFVSLFPVRLVRFLVRQFPRTSVSMA